MIVRAFVATRLMCVQLGFRLEPLLHVVAGNISALGKNTESLLGYFIMGSPGRGAVGLAFWDLGLRVPML